MVKAKPDKQREQRIEQEIVVDAYDAQERAMGWFSYLEDQLRSPFLSKCIAPRAISPVRRVHFDIRPSNRGAFRLFG
ncbi:MAG: calcium-binding protein [Limisphaerales bacterium]